MNPSIHIQTNKKSVNYENSNFSQSSGYGQYPLDDVAGHGQITEGAGTVNFNKLITNCIAIFLLGL
jgi:hypothetical protein